MEKIHFGLLFLGIVLSFMLPVGETQESSSTSKVVPRGPLMGMTPTKWEIVVNGQPRSKTAKNYLILDKGDDATLVCSSSMPQVSLFVPPDRNASLKVANNSAEIFEDNLNSSATTTYRRVLEIHNAQWFNTQTPECRVGTMKEKVHIFVRDPLQPFQPDGPYLTYYKVNGSYHPLSVRCGVTDPYLKVDLFGSDGVSIKSRHKYTWVPAWGFIVYNPNTTYMREVVCKTVTSDGVERSKRFTALKELKAESPSTEPPLKLVDRPSVTASLDGVRVPINNNKIRAFKGDNVEILCTGSRKVKWVWTKSVKEADTKVVVTGDTDVKRLLNITDIEEGNEKEYTCQYFDMKGSKFPTIKVEVEEPGPPEIIALMDSIRLEKGVNRTVTCKGRKPITWIWKEPDISGFVTGNDVTVTYGQNPDVNEHLSYLHLTIAQWYNSRMYICRYQKSSDNKDDTTNNTDVTTAKPMKKFPFNLPPGMEMKKFPLNLPPGMVIPNQPKKKVSEFEELLKSDQAAHIFIFVADPDEPFQKPTRTGYGTPIWVKYGEPLELNCGVTDPLLKVRLSSNELDKTDEKGVEWNPQTGFVVLDASFDFTFNVKCITSTKTRDREEKKFRVAKASGGDNLSPKLMATKYSLIAGDTWVLTCYVKVMNGKPRSYISITFNFKEKGKSDRFEESNLLHESNGGNVVISRNLTIKNIQVSDQGNYSCQVTRNTKNYYSYDQSIRVYEKPFIELEPNSKVVSVLDNATTAQLAVTIFAVPTPTVEWYFEGYKLKRQYPILWSQSKTLTKLNVVFPKTDSSGTYTARAFYIINNDTNTFIEAKASIALWVKGKPSVKIQTMSNEENLPKGVYTVEKDDDYAKFTCVVKGIPKSNVTFFFQPCRDRICNESSISDDLWKEIPNQVKRIVESKGKEKFILHTPAKTSGFIMCLAENKYGNQTDYLKSVVTDKKGILDISDNHHKKAIGDSLRITCSANKWLFSSVNIKLVCSSPDSKLPSNATLDLSKDNNASNSPVAITTDSPTVFALDSGINTTSPTTTPRIITYPHVIWGMNNYSIQVTMVFDKLKASDEKAYYCEAISSVKPKRDTHKGGIMSFPDKFCKEYQLRLTPISKPKLHDQTKGSRRVGVGASAAFQCCFSGFPAPKILWYKDRQPVVFNTSNVYKDRESSTCNAITFSGAENTRSSSLVIRNATLNDVGVYSCAGTNYGAVVVSENMTLQVGDAPSQAGFSSDYIGIIVAIVIVVIIIFIIVIIRIKRAKPGFHKELEQYLIQPQGSYNPDLPMDEQTGCLPYDPKWEFPKDRLRLGMILGQGAFGRVMKAEAVGIVDTEDVTVVAVKMVKDCTDKDQMMALLSELKILIHVGQHLNIVNLLGAVTKDIRFGELNVIVEYCHFGNLHNYLIKNKEKFRDTMEELPGLDSSDQDGTATKTPHYVNKAGGAEGSAELLAPSLTTKNLYCWAFQVARGMEYLACKTYIHRDLAARNVLLAADNVVKICDFGLAKELYHDQYQKKGQGKVPVKWMALESFTHRIYTTKSDVWSYGILLWELFTLGGNPYPGIEINEKFISLLKSGYRMERPLYSSEELYKIMLQTWKLDADERPTFSKLVATMGDFLEANTKQYYLDLDDPYHTMSGDDQDEEMFAKEIPTDSDGYLTMAPYKEKENGKIPSKDALNDSISELDETMPHYINDRKWRKEKAEEFELDLLIGHRRRSNSIPEDDAPGFPNVDQSTQMHIVAEVHQPEDDDSGHSSSYEGAASSPTETDDYLIPVSLGAQEPSNDYLEPIAIKDHQPNDALPNVNSIDNPSYIIMDDAVPLLQAPPRPSGASKGCKPSNSSSAYPGDYRNLKKQNGGKVLASPSCSAMPSSTPSCGSDSIPKSNTSANAKASKPMPNSMDVAIPRFHSNTKVYSQAKNRGPENKPASLPLLNAQSTLSPSAARGEDGAVGLAASDAKRNGAVPPRLLISTSSSGYHSDMSPSEFSPPPDYRTVMEDAIDQNSTR